MKLSSRLSVKLVVSVAVLAVCVVIIFRVFSHPTNNTKSASEQSLEGADSCARNCVAELLFRLGVGSQSGEIPVGWKAGSKQSLTEVGSFLRSQAINSQAVKVDWEWFATTAFNGMFLGHLNREHYVNILGYEKERNCIIVSDPPNLPTLVSREQWLKEFSGKGLFIPSSKHSFGVIWVESETQLEDKTKEQVHISFNLRYVGEDAFKNLRLDSSCGCIEEQITQIGSGRARLKATVDLRGKYGLIEESLLLGGEGFSHVYKLGVKFLRSETLIEPSHVRILARSDQVGRWKIPLKTSNGNELLLIDHKDTGGFEHNFKFGITGNLSQGYIFEIFQKGRIAAGNYRLPFDIDVRGSDGSIRKEALHVLFNNRSFINASTDCIYVMKNCFQNGTAHQSFEVSSVDRKPWAITGIDGGKGVHSSFKELDGGQRYRVTVKLDSWDFTTSNIIVRGECSDGLGVALEIPVLKIDEARLFSGIGSDTN